MRSPVPSSGEPAPPESVFLRTGPPPGRSPWDRHPLPEKPGRFPIIDGPLGLLDADHLGALLEFRQHAVCLPSLDLQGRLAFLPRIPFWQAYLRDLEFYHMRILKSIRKSLDFAKLSGPFPVRTARAAEGLPPSAAPLALFNHSFFAISSAIGSPMA